MRRSWGWYKNNAVWFTSSGNAKSWIARDSLLKIAVEEQIEGKYQVVSQEGRCLTQTRNKSTRKSVTKRLELKRKAEHRNEWRHHQLNRSYYRVDTRSQETRSRNLHRCTWPRLYGCFFWLVGCACLKVSGIRNLHQHSIRHKFLDRVSALVWQEEEELDTGLCVTGRVGSCVSVTIGVRARGLEGLQPPDSTKTIIFRAKASSQKWEKVYFVFIKRKNGIHPV